MSHQELHHGPQPGSKQDRGLNRKKGPKGIARLKRELKRDEAEERQQSAPTPAGEAYRREHSANE